MGGIVSAGELSDGAHRLMSDPDHWMIRQIGGARTRAGVSVNEHSAMTLPAAFGAIRVIASAMAQVPCQLMQRSPSPVAGRMATRAATEHPLYDVVASRWNDRQTSHRGRQTVFGHAAGWGNGYVEIERTRGGQAVGLWPLLPDRTSPQLVQDQLVYDTNVDNRRFRIPADDVLHFAGMGWDGYVGYSPIALARQAVGLGLAAEAFGAGFFANDARSGGVLIHPGKLSDPAKGRVRSDFEQQGGLDNAHRVKVLEEGMKFVATTIPPEDAQFLGTQEWTVAQIARMFGVPLFLLHSHEKATSWGSGLEEMSRAFVQYTLADWAVGAEQEMNAKLLSAAERAAGYYFKFNLNAYLRGDTEARRGMYKDGINDGWLNRNEARELEDLNPAEGLDDFLVPLNMTTVADLEQARADAASAAAAAARNPTPALPAPGTPEAPEGPDNAA